MKKILFFALILSCYALPALSVCSITGGACSDFTSKPLQERLVPNNLQNIQTPNTFQRDIMKPESFNTINNPQSPAKDYNQNNQFGITLPANNKNMEP